MAKKKQKVSENAPTHYLKMKARDPREKGWVRVAACWENENGNLTIKIKRGVILDWHDFVNDYLLVVVPANDYDPDNIPF